jgi:hypothetical protein
MLKPNGFWFLVGIVGFVTAATIPMADGAVKLPKTSEEQRAVAAAKSFIADNPTYRYALKRTPGIQEGWTSYSVSFPPACSMTGSAGPIVAVAKGTYAVSNVVLEDAICAGPGWLAKAHAGSAG